MAVTVEGLSGLQRAFNRASKAEGKLLRAGLIEAAQPVKRAAEGRAMSKITRMPRSPQWSVMRIGSARSVVYMVPKQKGRKSKTNPRARRPNLKDLLLDRAMIPAVEENTVQVEATVANVLDTVGKIWAA